MKNYVPTTVLPIRFIDKLYCYIGPDYSYVEQFIASDYIQPWPIISHPKVTGLYIFKIVLSLALALIS